RAFTSYETFSTTAIYHDLFIYYQTSFFVISNRVSQIHFEVSFRSEQIFLIPLALDQRMSKSRWIMSTSECATSMLRETATTIPGRLYEMHLGLSFIRQERRSLKYKLRVPRQNLEFQVETSQL